MFRFDLLYSPNTSQVLILTFLLCSTAVAQCLCGFHGLLTIKNYFLIASFIVLYVLSSVFVNLFFLSVFKKNLAFLSN